MIRLFTGFDQREAVGWHAFAQSLIERASEPVQLIPMAQAAQRDGSNAFTYSRFLIPSLCDFSGWAIFVDGADMLLQADIAELWRLRDPRYAVQVVKHDYRTKYRRKYIGTVMECENRDYPRKNWSSVILWNCGHIRNFFLSPQNVADSTGADLHRFSWLADDEIGELPRAWNWLADEYGGNTAAKLLHFTAGIPAIFAHQHVPHAQDWFLTVSRACSGPMPHASQGERPQDPICIH